MPQLFVLYPNLTVWENQQFSQYEPGYAFAARESISWLPPTTYGTLLLRDIALRGTDPNWLLLGGLAAIGLVSMLISWRLMRRLISSSQ